VLEIGSGSGWFAAVMARLVGPKSQVTGIELIPDLATQSRANLAALGIGNVEVITGDGTRGHAAGAPCNSAVITAATWDVPAALLDQVAARGLGVVPVELRGGNACTGHPASRTWTAPRRRAKPCARGPPAAARAGRPR